MRTVYSAVLALLLAGCSTFPLRGAPPTIAELDVWLDNNEFGRVVAALNEVPRDHPDYIHYAARRTAAEQRAREYEEKTLGEIAVIESRKDWPAAITLTDEALANYPESLPLSRKRVELISKQQHRARILSAESLLARTDWLQNELPLLRQKARNAPVDIPLQWSVSQLENELRTSVAKLISTATDLFEYSEYDLVQQCLDRANELSPNPNEVTTINLLQERLIVRRAEERQKQLVLEKQRAQQLTAEQRAEQNKRIKALKHKTQLALTRNDLSTAHQHAVELKRLLPDDIEVLQLHSEINSRIMIVVDKMIAQGNSLYRQEKIADAKKTWEKALTLDPGNRELIANIQRAERVLQKLDDLRESQQTTSQP